MGVHLVPDPIPDPNHERPKEPEGMPAFSYRVKQGHIIRTHHRTLKAAQERWILQVRTLKSWGIDPSEVVIEKWIDGEWKAVA